MFLYSPFAVSECVSYAANSKICIYIYTNTHNINTYESIYIVYMLNLYNFLKYPYQRSLELRLDVYLCILKLIYGTPITINASRGVIQYLRDNTNINIGINYV